MKILLLDDEENILSATKRMLERIGHEVDCVNDAKAAVEPIEKGGYDLALVDYLMPERDGIWFMQNAKIPKTTKVLLVTAFVNRQVVNEAMKLGAQGYLIKPVSAEDLAKNIQMSSSGKTS